MATTKVMLNVRVPPDVMGRLNARVDQARHSGRRVTKERLVCDAIIAAYPDLGEDRHQGPPVHESEWMADVDPRSNAALLDLLDDTEAAT